MHITQLFHLKVVLQFYGAMPLKILKPLLHLKITAPHLLEHGIIDGAIKEPTRGAHTDYEFMGS